MRRGRPNVLGSVRAAAEEQCSWSTRGMHCEGAQCRREMRAALCWRRTGLLCRVGDGARREGKRRAERVSWQAVAV
jgi:hypothetical protein